MNVTLTRESDLDECVRHAIKSFLQILHRAALEAVTVPVFVHDDKTQVEPFGQIKQMICGCPRPRVVMEML